MILNELNLLSSSPPSGWRDCIFLFGVLRDLLHPGAQLLQKASEQHHSQRLSRSRPFLAFQDWSRAYSLRSAARTLRLHENDEPVVLLDDLKLILLPDGKSHQHVDHISEVFGVAAAGSLVRIE